MTRWFDQVQIYLLATLLLVAPNTIRRVLWETPALYQDIFVDFRGVQVFLFDLPVGLLWVVTGVRLLVDGMWRRQFTRRMSMLAGGRWWLLLVIWMGMSGLWALHPTLTAYVVVRWLAAFGVALIVTDLTARGYVAELVWCVLLSALVQSLVALGQWLTGGALGLASFGEIPMQSRPLGLTVNPNNLAGFLLMALGAGGWLLWQRRGALTLIWVLAVIALALVSTSSRAALLGCVLVAGYLLLRRQITLKRLLMVVGLLVLLVAVTYRPGRDLSEYMSRAFYEAEDAVALIRQEPLRGVGAGNLMVRVVQLRGGEDRRLRLPAHNTLLVVWAELGMVGLLIVMFAVMDMLRQSVYHLIVWVLLLCPAVIFDYYLWIDYRSHIVLIYLLGLLWGRLCLKSHGS